MGSATRILLAGLHVIIYNAVHTVGDHDTILAFDCFIRDGFGKVNGQEDGVHLPANWVEWSFQ